MFISIKKYLDRHVSDRRNPEHGHEVSRIITSNRIKQEISEKTFTDESLAELDDIINEYIHNQKEQEMIKLLKENLEKMCNDKK